ncbi:RNA polymerase sigma-70 factor, ECF subfamily [Paenibacillus polysaccharolyticus]|uniref:RNA polymerase sigma-70 factor, ECF subfamily n=1 Tax=Paenibacillus polysaccharolyticus TaxID=582692 RepID=A0A1G5F571_9BACL|nr:sigma-70 family RNA polymerase sigma factor [Paenibacillus polysaccharolyticus]SCY34241.1 RNA polymerase sigma-70 factor, ECF subfamily [Paenibacillus polysaccharolyticus]
MDARQMAEQLQPKLREIRHYLIRLGASPSDAEDILQETVYKAFLYIDSIEKGKFSAWLYKVAINRYYDLCRRKKWAMVPIESVEIPDSSLPEDAILQQEKKEKVEAVLGELAPLHRQLLIMKYEMELSYQEIAELLGMRMEQVKASLYQARQQFKKKYGSE